MKAKLVLSLFVLGLATTGFGNILIGNFENDGLDLGNGPGGTTATVVSGTGNTLGSNAMQVVRVAGGWGGSYEFYVGGSPARQALASVGQVTVDLTAFAADFPAGWAQIGLMVNCGGSDPTNPDGWSWWNAYDWRGIAADGQTHSLTFQLPADAMAALGNADWWANIGLIGMTGDNSADPITGEPVYPSMATWYIDNVQVVIPEPATLTMLGLGALSLLRRKR